MNHLRSQYSLSRYFTPPRIKPLNLDLARLDGGGYAPAQLYGQTHDGRDVYVRYRGGAFSVWVASEPGRDAYAADDSICILKGQIGPPLHGGMTVGQACQYFGITINGTCPPMPTPEEMLREGCKDLGGASTFYDVWLSSTFDTQQGFLKAALAALPKATLILPILDQGKLKGYGACPAVEGLASDFSYIFLGDPMTADALANLTEERVGLYDLGDYTVIRLVMSGFQYPIRKYGNNDAGRVHRLTGKVIFVAGQVDECMYGSISLHSRFLTSDSDRRTLLHNLDGLLDEFYPPHEIAWFDLLTGNKELEDNHVMHLDPNVANWLNAGPDRWLHIRNKGDVQRPRFSGSRAIRIVR